MNVSLTKPQRKRKDTRVTRTRNKLGDALIELMQERPFDQITVQDVLDRAEVSRSTFYSHYTNKEDLFLGDVDDFWEHMATMLSRQKEKSNRVAPVKELFAHVADVGDFRAALISAGKIHDVMDLGREHFARGIANRLLELPQASNVSDERRAVLAQMFSGALFSLLDCWINRKTSHSAAQMDDFFHQMAWGALMGEGANTSQRDSAR